MQEYLKVHTFSLIHSIFPNTNVAMFADDTCIIAEHIKTLLRLLHFFRNTSRKLQHGLDYGGSKLINTGLLLFTLLRKRCPLVMIFGQTSYIGE